MSAWLDALLYTWVLPYVMYWLVGIAGLVGSWHILRHGASLRDRPPWWKPR